MLAESAKKVASSTSNTFGIKALEMMFYFHAGDPKCAAFDIWFRLALPNSVADLWGFHAGAHVLLPRWRRKVRGGYHALPRHVAALARTMLLRWYGAAHLLLSYIVPILAHNAFPTCPRRDKDAVRDLMCMAAKNLCGSYAELAVRIPPHSSLQLMHETAYEDSVQDLRPCICVCLWTQMTSANA